MFSLHTPHYPHRKKKNPTPSHRPLTLNPAGSALKSSTHPPHLTEFQKNVPPTRSLYSHIQYVSSTPVFFFVFLLLLPFECHLGGDDDPHDDPEQPERTAEDLHDENLDEERGVLRVRQRARASIRRVRLRRYESIRVVVYTDVQTFVAT